MTVAVDEIRESLLAEEARASRLDEVQSEGSPYILSEGSLRHKPGDEEKLESRCFNFPELSQVRIASKLSSEICLCCSPRSIQKCLRHVDSLRSW